MVAGSHGSKWPCRIVSRLELLEGWLQPSLFGPPTFYPFGMSGGLFQDAARSSAGQAELP